MYCIYIYIYSHHCIPRWWLFSWSFDDVWCSSMMFDYDCVWLCVKMFRLSNACYDVWLWRWRMSDYYWICWMALSVNYDSSEPVEGDGSVYCQMRKRLWYPCVGDCHARADLSMICWIVRIVATPELPINRDLAQFRADYII